MAEHDATRRRRRWWIALGVLLLLLAGAGWVAFRIARVSDEFFVSDAAQMIAYDGLPLCHSETPPARTELESLAMRLHEASVIHLWYDDAGRVVDAWGTPFSFEMETDEHGPTLTVESAGPDRRFGTEDDISRSASLPE